MNQYEIAKSNRYGYGSVFAPRYNVPVYQSTTLAEPTGRFGCLLIGTKPDVATLEETYCNVYSEANHKATAAFPWIPGSESYAYPDIARVFNVYIDGVRKGECPEYFPYKENGTLVNAAPVNWENAVNYIVKRVPELRKYTSASGFVQTVFYHAGDLYALNEKFIRPDTLWPLTFDSRDPGNPRMNKWYNERQEDLKEESEKKKGGPLDDFNDLISNLLTLAIVGIGVYVAMPLITGRR
jgi:hypothetical protein